MKEKNISKNGKDYHTEETRNCIFILTLETYAKRIIKEYHSTTKKSLANMTAQTELPHIRIRFRRYIKIKYDPILTLFPSPLV